MRTGCQLTFIVKGIRQRMGKDFHKLASWIACSDETVIQLVTDEAYNGVTPPSWSDLISQNYEIKLYPHEQGKQTLEHVIKELILWLPCFESEWKNEYPKYQSGKKNCLRYPHEEVEVPIDLVKVMQNFLKENLMILQ